ncbi:hypothetical protein CDAR_451401 [Caerostris darwini]|uniref:Cystatin domain-containing protein n=1 Tax=Caerostris darwini TaxID=1538125 RepID=A0AAV4SCP4_9ARAC|nr:hypothetical protein CDAR_451401 [Caerostris darwini]
MGINKLSSSIHSAFHLKVINITHAEKQVVSGMNYNMGVQLAPSNCSRTNTYTEEEFKSCVSQKCDHPLTCNITLWVKPWLDDPVKLTRTECDYGDRFC